jgi:hypothetical protein
VLDAAEGELSTGRTLFYLLSSISEAAKPLFRKGKTVPKVSNRG